MASRSFREVQVRSYKITNALAAAGVRPGQMAAVYCPNSVIAFECILGIVRGAVVYVPINQTLVNDLAAAASSPSSATSCSPAALA